MENYKTLVHPHGEIVEVTGKCQYRNCEQAATDIAVGDESPLGFYCEVHASIVVDEHSPEYRVSCPNCACGFGVN